MSRPNQNRSCGRGPLFAASGQMPAPLGPLRRTAEEPLERAVLPEPAPLTLRPAAQENMRICRYTNPIPTPVDPAQAEIVCLMRRQNELLTEILAALQANAAQA